MVTDEGHDPHELADALDAVLDIYNEARAKLKASSHPAKAEVEQKLKVYRDTAIAAVQEAHDILQKELAEILREGRTTE